MNSLHGDLCVFFYPHWWRPSSLKSNRIGDKERYSIKLNTTSVWTRNSDRCKRLLDLSIFQKSSFWITLEERGYQKGSIWRFSGILVNLNLLKFKQSLPRTDCCLYTVHHLWIIWEQIIDRWIVIKNSAYFNSLYVKNWKQNNREFAASLFMMFLRSVQGKSEKEDLL